MIGRLRGVIAERGSDGTCVVDVLGVGYDVTVPLGALGKLPAGDDTVILHIHTHVREEAFQLFGFPTQEDRSAFRAILGVSGVGPRIAMAILGTFDAEGLARAITIGDPAAFRGVSGVGKKTAERLILELQDKLPKVAARSKVVAKAAGQGTKSTVAATVTAALVQMGYRPAQAEQAVAQVPNPESRSMEEILRDALGHLG